MKHTAQLERLESPAPLFRVVEKQGLLRNGEGRSAGLGSILACYSYRSATIGSTFDARRAGRYPATRATAVMAAMANPMLAAS